MNPPDVERILRTRNDVVKALDGVPVDEGVTALLMALAEAIVTAAPTHAKVLEGTRQCNKQLRELVNEQCHTGRAVH